MGWPGRWPRPSARLITMTIVAVTVVGHDRPGIVAEVAGAVAAVGGNLEDSSMTLLRGHFAMTLIADVAEAGELRRRLAHLEADDLSVSVLGVPTAEAVRGPNPQILSLHGSDRPGIVSRTASLLADFGGNITDISTHLGSDLYVLTAEVQFPPDVDLADVRAAVQDLSRTLGVSAVLRPAEEYVL
jgi:glycine cleavage system transcriptional repressor